VNDLSHGAFMKKLFFLLIISFQFSCSHGNKIQTESNRDINSIKTFIANCNEPAHSTRSSYEFNLKSNKDGTAIARFNKGDQQANFVDYLLTGRNTSFRGRDDNSNLQIDLSLSENSLIRSKQNH